MSHCLHRQSTVRHGMFQRPTRNGYRTREHGSDSGRTQHVCTMHLYRFLFQQAQVSLGLVEESIRRCLLSAVTNINLSESTAKAVDGDAWRNNDHVAEAFNRNAYAVRLVFLRRINYSLFSLPSNENPKKMVYC